MFEFEIPTTVDAVINLELETAGKVKKGTIAIEYHYRETSYVDALIERVRNGSALDSEIVDNEIAGVRGLAVKGVEHPPEVQLDMVRRHLPLRQAAIEGWAPALKMASAKNSKALPKR